MSGNVLWIIRWTIYLDPVNVSGQSWFRSIRDVRGAQRRANFDTMAYIFRRGWGGGNEDELN